MMEEYPDVLTAEEASEVLRVSCGSLYCLLKSGKLKGFRYGKVWRIPKAAIQEYVLSQMKGSR